MTKRHSTFFGAGIALGVLATLACASTTKETSPSAIGDKPVAEKPVEKPAQDKDAKKGEGRSPLVDAKAKAEIGKPAPDFVLKDLDGKEHKLSSFKGKNVVLEWFDPSCPACMGAYGEGGALRGLPEKLAKDGVVWLAVNSANPEARGAPLEKNKAFVEKYQLKTPILLDPTGAVGRAYVAKTTPHCMVIDAKGVLVYRGAVDNAPDGKTEDGSPVVNYVTKALDAVKAGKAVEPAETRSYG